MEENLSFNKRLDRAGQRPYRSFKIRYLMIAMPVMLVIAGILSFLLTTVAARKLRLQQTEEIKTAVSEKIEQLRLVILSQNMPDLDDFMQEMAREIGAGRIDLFDDNGNKIHGFEDERAGSGVFTLEYEHLMLMQSSLGKVQRWRFVASIKPDSRFEVVDDFLVYQLLIILSMFLGMAVGTFWAFDKAVVKPVSIVKNLLVQTRECVKNIEVPLPDFQYLQDESELENDEFSQLAILVKEMSDLCVANKTKYETFCSLFNIAFFEIDRKSFAVKASGNLPVLQRKNSGPVASLDDIAEIVVIDYRSDFSLGLLDLKKQLNNEAKGEKAFELLVDQCDPEKEGIFGKCWFQMIVSWDFSSGDERARGFLRHKCSEKEHELKLLAELEKFRKGFETLPAGIWRSRNDKFLYMNSAMAEILGYSSPDEAIARIRSITHDIYVSPVDRTFLFDEMRRRGVVKDLEMRFLRANGEVFWGAMFARLYTEKNIQYVEGVFVDITTRKQSEEMLRNNEIFLRTALDMSGAVTWQIEPVSGEMAFRGPWVKLAGLNAEEIKSLKDFYKIIYSEDLQGVTHLIERIKKSEGMGNRDRDTIEFRICRLNSENRTQIRWIRCYIGLFDCGFGSRSGFLRGLMLDVSSQKEAEEELKQAISRVNYESREKLKFFANLSHDIRTPLNAITGFSELLETVEIEGKGDQYLKSIVAASRSLGSIIDGILDLTRLEAGKIELVSEPADLKRIMDDLKTTFAPEAERKGLDFKTHFDATLPENVMLDEFRLKQILSSLLANAIKFTSTGSIGIRIETAHSEYQNLVNLNIFVEDTGIGIPESDLKDLFDPFTSKKSRGDRIGCCGISLAICSRLVNLMRGTLAARSDIERGTRFEIRLKDIPVSDARGNDSEKYQSNLRSLRFYEQKVLVADDTASNRELMAEALGGIGLQVIVAANGNEAVELAKVHMPDLIFMDIRMPDKDGICAARELKCSPDTSAIPIVAVTASVSFSEEERIKGFFDGFLNKPLRLSLLFAEAARFLKHNRIVEDSKPSEAAFAVPPEAFEQLSDPWEFGEVAKIELMPVLKQLEGAVMVDVARAFATNLKTLSVAHSFNILSLEADKCASAARAFDIAGLRESLIRIRKIIDQFFRLYSR